MFFHTNCYKIVEKEKKESNFLHTYNLHQQLVLTEYWVNKAGVLGKYRQQVKKLIKTSLLDKEGSEQTNGV